LIGMADFVIGDRPEPNKPEPDPAGATVDPTKLPKELRAHAVTTAPTIDGQIEDAWSAATPLVFETDWAGRQTSASTRVRAMWSPTGLYLLFDLVANSTFTDTDRPIDVERVDLYEENCIELFLVPDPTNRDRYFEIEVGPFGHFFDIAVDRKAKPRADTKWSGHLRIGTTRDQAKQHATIEIAIEAPDVLAALGTGKSLPIGLYRMEGKGKRLYLAAFPTRTPKPSFHVPEAFGTLVLE